MGDAERSGLTCCICEEVVTLPKDFPCRHCACETCLTQYCVNNAGENGFPCPKCKKEVHVKDPTKPIIEWIDTFPTNYDKVKKLEKMGIGGSDMKVYKCVLCAQKHITVRATKYCKACEEYFCDECGNQHWLLRASKEHRVKFISDMDLLQGDKLLRAYLLVIFNAKINGRKRSASGDNKAHTNTSKVAPDTATDTDDCKITGAAFLDNGNILLADQRNNKLKLFDKNYIFRTSVEVQCWDVLELNEYTHVVSCPVERCLRYYTILGNEIKEVRKVHTDESCYGICVANSKLVAACVGDSVTLTIFDENGDTSFEISKGELSLSLPHYIAYDGTNGHFIITDSSSGCVVCVDESGVIVWERSIGDGKGVDMCGNNLLMARKDHNTVDLLNSKGQSVKSIASGEDGLEKSMALCIENKHIEDNCKRLLVSDKSDLVRIFAVEDPMAATDDCLYNGEHLHDSGSIDSQDGKSKTCIIL